MVPPALYARLRRYCQVEGRIIKVTASRWIEQNLDSIALAAALEKSELKDPPLPSDQAAGEPQKALETPP